MEGNQSRRCFFDWMNLQQLDLAELLQALSLQKSNPHPRHHHHHDDDVVGPVLAELAQKIVGHFQDYADRRASLAQNDDVSSFFAPSWNSPLENSLLWLAGCRPSMFIRLLYALCGSQLDQSMFSAGADDEESNSVCTAVASGNLGDLSWRQMNLVNELHLKTVREEERLTSRLASLQEDVGDNPICRFVATTSSCSGNERDGEVEKALEEHDRGMVSILMEADKLRLSTLKEVVHLEYSIDGLHACGAIIVKPQPHQWSLRPSNTFQSGSSGHTIPLMKRTVRCICHHGISSCSPSITSKRDSSTPNHLPPQPPASTSSNSSTAGFNIFQFLSRPPHNFQQP